MAICEECGKTYYSKICPYCNNINIDENEIKKINEIKRKQNEMIKKANRLKINFGSGEVNAEYNRKRYKKILANRIKDKNFLHQLEHKDPRLKSGKITHKKEVKKNNETTIYILIIIGILIIIALLKN